MSDTPETDKCIEGNKHIKFLQQDHWIGTDKFTYENPIVDLCRKLERELKEAVEFANNFSYLAWKLEAERNKAVNAIRETLEENRHLADGDDCTLRKLKAIVPNWE